MSKGEWINKLVYSYNMILISNEEKATKDRDSNMDGYQKTGQWKKPDIKEYIPMIPFICSSTKCKMTYGGKNQKRSCI